MRTTCGMRRTPTDRLAGHYADDMRLLEAREDVPEAVVVQPCRRRAGRSSRDRSLGRGLRFGGGHGDVALPLVPMRPYSVWSSAPAVYTSQNLFDVSSTR